MERPLKNRVSSLLILITACQLGLGLVHAEGKADITPASPNTGATDTSLTVEALRHRGAELDNFIYEASDSSAKESPTEENIWLRPQTLWIAAGVACLIGIGLAYLLSGSGN